MKRSVLSSAFLIGLSFASLTAERHVTQGPATRAGDRDHMPAASVYFPPAGEWAHRTPEDVGMDAALLDQAIAYASAHETKRPRDYSDQVKVFGAPLGPVPMERGGTNGLVIRHGYIVAEFGDTTRVEPTYSAAKSVLSTILGITIDRGMIRNVQDPVKSSVNDGGYDSPHNAKVTWHQHAQQTSEWEGTMWGKKDDFVGLEAFGDGRREPRQLQDPGTYYEYNDVRINRFSLSMMRLWKRPLPEVFNEYVMDPIGASSTWKYLGYKNSDVVIDGKTMPSVSGGTRWGGGLWINSRDQARFGYLFLNRGRWGDQQIVSESWVRQATTPSELGPDYGYLWWLNTQRKQWPHASTKSFAAVGFGSNTIWVDPEHDLVVVWRWHDETEDELFRQIVASIKDSAVSQ